MRLDGRSSCIFFFQAEDGIRDKLVTGVQTCALPISHQAAWLQSHRSVMIDVHKEAGFNVLSTTQSIKDLVPALQASLPPLAKLTVVGDRTQLIQSSVGDVQFTMLLTIALVVMVIFVFLRNI